MKLTKEVIQDNETIIKMEFEGEKNCYDVLWGINWTIEDYRSPYYNPTFQGERILKTNREKNRKGNIEISEIETEYKGKRRTYRYTLYL